MMMVRCIMMILALTSVAVQGSCPSPGGRLNPDPRCWRPVYSRSLLDSVAHPWLSAAACKTTLPRSSCRPTRATPEEYIFTSNLIDKTKQAQIHISLQDVFTFCLHVRIFFFTVSVGYPFHVVQASIVHIFPRF